MLNWTAQPSLSNRRRDPGCGGYSLRVSETISAIASLLWPLIVLAVLVLFRGPLASLVRSTASRDFTIKIAGQEVSVGELHRQQMDMMSDLHNQVVALQKEVDGLKQGTPARLPSPSPAPAPTPAPSPADVPVAASVGAATRSAAPAGMSLTAHDTELTDVDNAGQANVGMVKAPWERLELAHDEQPEEPALTLSVVPPPAPIDQVWTSTHPDTRPKPAGVLWVDDTPAHYALQLDQLERRGVVVDIARSTKEAVQKLTSQRYQIIVSDMERIEAGQPVPDAGVELLRTVRTFDHDTPVVIFSTHHLGGKVLTDAAAKIGADLVTTSWFELSRELHRVGVL